MSAHAILVTAFDRPGMMSALTTVLADHGANITHVDIHPGSPTTGIYFEVTIPDERAQSAINGLKAVAGVERVEETPSSAKIYGKRIIVIGGGAQVGQVAMGAISEADRHNIRGERISVDTIPLVGEQELAAAVRSVMGGEVSRAVLEVRARGIMVVSLNMAGSVPDAADLVVTDPVQAGVMTVMAVADTAKFDLMRQLKKRY